MGQSLSFDVEDHRGEYYIASSLKSALIAKIADTRCSFAPKGSRDRARSLITTLPQLYADVAYLNTHLAPLFTDPHHSHEPVSAQNPVPARRWWFEVACRVPARAALAMARAEVTDEGECWHRCNTFVVTAALIPVAAAASAATAAAAVAAASAAAVANGSGSGVRPAYSNSSSLASPNNNNGGGSDAAVYALRPSEFYAVYLFMLDQSVVVASPMHTPVVGATAAHAPVPPESAHATAHESAHAAAHVAADATAASAGAGKYVASSAPAAAGAAAAEADQDAIAIIPKSSALEEVEEEEDGAKANGKGQSNNKNSGKDKGNGKGKGKGGKGGNTNSQGNTDSDEGKDKKTESAASATTATDATPAQPEPAAEPAVASPSASSVVLTAEEEEAAELCAICFNNKVSTVLPCSHAFCNDCLDGWTKSNMNSSNSNRSAPLGSDPGGAGDSEAAEETCCPMCRDPTAGSAHRYDLVDKDDGRQFVIDNLIARLRAFIKKRPTVALRPEPAPAPKPASMPAPAAAAAAAASVPAAVPEAASPPAKPDSESAVAAEDVSFSMDNDKSSGRAPESDTK